MFKQRKLTQRNILPGFGLSFGITLFMLSFIVLIPLSAVIFKSADLGWEGFWNAVTNRRSLAALRLSFSVSFYAACFDVAAGLLIAWVLTRYRFAGRRFFDAIVDLPFALPTAVAGIALTTLYSKNGWIGKLTYQWGWETAYSPLGIGIALAFIGLPFVVRSVQPILAELEPEMEEAAASLGASRVSTFLKILFPELFPALMTGFTMAFARALGEYGSVVFISGNMPLKTEILPLLVMTQLENYEYEKAAALATTMLGFSFLFLLAVNLLQRWTQQRRGMA